jgi:hypothetical protein
MNTIMTADFDQLRRAAGAANRAFDHRGGRTRDRNDAAIVVAIHFPAQDEYARHATDGIYNRTHEAFIAAFGKIGDAFDHAVRS